MEAQPARLSDGEREVQSDAVASGLAPQVPPAQRRFPRSLYAPVRAGASRSASIARHFSAGDAAERICMKRFLTQKSGSSLCWLRNMDCNE